MDSLAAERVMRQAHREFMERSIAKLGIVRFVDTERMQAPTATDRLVAAMAKKRKKPKKPSGY
jgi:hypothetical protein